MNLPSPVGAHGCVVLACLLFLGPHLSLSAQGRSADAFFREAMSLFFDGKSRESVTAFDHGIVLQPFAAPQLWQRGLSLYYAEDYKEGREQFELHQTVNPNDVENAAWHFICVARVETLEAARAALIPIKGDSRVPMAEVHDLLAGTGSEEAVLKAASQGDPGSETLRNQLCYAHLYLGLYEEALGHAEKAKEHMLKAAVDYKMDHYMGMTAQVHVKIRGWNQKQGPPVGAGAP